MHFNPFGGRIFVVARPKLGVLEHVGVLFSDALFSDDSVMHSTPERGTHRSTAEEFAQGHDVRIVREIPRELHWTVLQRAYWIEMNPRRYEVFGSNCVDFVNWLIAPGQPEVASRPLWA